MLTSPIEAGESLRIGTVEKVEPDQIRVQLDLQAPYDVAAGDGRSPLRFPRINDYVLIPYGGGNVVAQIAWIGIKEDTSPSHQQLRQDPSLLDLPFPTRKMGVNPLGVLRRNRGEVTQDIDAENESQPEENGSESEEHQDKKKPPYKLERGLNTYPSVGEAVLLPTDKQLRSIVESGEKRVFIGVNPQAANADVWVDPDKLFGRHLAVLGNTGSGKSCSVAGLIRWSIKEAEKEKKRVAKEKAKKAAEEAAKKAAEKVTEEVVEEAGKRKAEEAGEEKSGENINARFIILDPSGEYAKAFRDIGAQIFRVSENPGELQPKNGVEDKNQYEQLRVPLWFWNLEEWINFTQPSEGAQLPLLKEVLKKMKTNKAQEDHLTPFSIEEFLHCLFKLAEREGWDILSLLKEIKDEVGKMLARGEALSLGTEWAKYLDGAVKQRLSKHRKMDRKKQEYVRPLLARIEIMVGNLRNNKLITDDDKNTNLACWLKDHLEGDQPSDKHIRIIDLSLLSSNIVHIAVTVFSRMILEFLQRYRRYEEGQVLPTVLILDEAHRFIRTHQYEDGSKEEHSPEQGCRSIFEKIAREGRKYGLGLVIASQRPSELSPTILSQCNTFLLHRITNDRDQNLIQRLVPDNLRDLFGVLPVLPTRQAILTGWATKLPTRVQMRELEREQRPKSEDPDFWNVWTGGEEGNVKRDVDWESIANEWQGK